MNVMSNISCRAWPFRSMRLPLPGYRALMLSLLFACHADYGLAQTDNLTMQSNSNRVADLRLDPTSSASLSADLESHNYTEAETILVQEINRNPRTTHAAKSLELAGNIFFLDHKYLNAAIAWSKADAITPLNEQNRFSFAMADIQLKRPDWARKQLEILERTYPQNAFYKYWLARLDYDAQQYSSAISRLEKVIQLSPEMARAYDLLGLSYDYLGKTDQAIASYERAVALNRKYPHPSAWPNVDFAIALNEANRSSDAEAQLREALTYDDKLPQANYQMGLTMEHKGDTAAAIKFFKRAAELDPAYAEPHYALARAYRKAGKDDLAAAEVSRLNQLRQKDRQSADPQVH